MFIVLLVLFTVVMAVWLLSMLGAAPGLTAASPWLAFFACLILGIIVFLTGSGLVTVQKL